VQHSPWQVWRQRRATGLLEFCRPRRGPQRLQFQLDGCDVGVDFFVEQALLRGIELFAAGTELPTLQNRNLVGQLFDTSRAPDQLALLGLKLTVGVRQPGHQLLGQHPQFGLAELLELVAAEHGQRVCPTPVQATTGARPN